MKRQSTKIKASIKKLSKVYKGISKKEDPLKKATYKDLLRVQKKLYKKQLQIEKLTSKIKKVARTKAQKGIKTLKSKLATAKSVKKGFKELISHYKHTYKEIKQDSEFDKQRQKSYKENKEFIDKLHKQAEEDFEKYYSKPKETGTGGGDEGGIAVPPPLEPEDLKEKYKLLMEGKGNIEINRGILNALEDAGVDIKNPEELEKYLGVPGKSWEEIVDIIDANYKDLDFEDLFYSSPDTVNFSGEYFKDSLSTMIQKIRTGDYGNEG